MCVSVNVNQCCRLTTTSLNRLRVQHGMTPESPSKAKDPGGATAGVLVYVLCSSTMLVINKMAMTALPYSNAMTALQTGVGALLLYVLNKAGLLSKIDPTCADIFENSSVASGDGRMDHPYFSQYGCYEVPLSGNADDVPLALHRSRRRRRLLLPRDIVAAAAAGRLCHHFIGRTYIRLKRPLLQSDGLHLRRRLLHCNAGEFHVG